MTDKRVETLEAEIQTLHQTLQVRPRMRTRAAARGRGRRGTSLTAAWWHTQPHARKLRPPRVASRAQHRQASWGSSAGTREWAKGVGG